MKIILSILLSFTLLTTELPVSGWAVAESNLETEVIEGEQREENGKEDKDTESLGEDKSPAEEIKEEKENIGNSGEDAEPVEEKSVPMEKSEDEKQEPNKGNSEKKESSENGLTLRTQGKGLAFAQNQRAAIYDVPYVNKSGYFFFFVRKEGEKIENGEWYQLNLSVDSLFANESQKINWKMKKIGTIPVTQKNNVQEWIDDAIKKEGVNSDKFSMKIETGKAWEKTGQDDLGPNPVMGIKRNLTAELIAAGYPSENRYYIMCGKILYNMPGYRMYLDKSVFEDMKGMDIEEENQQIQKKDEDLKSNEQSWTGDGYFMFGIDTNNVGMTNYGASREFHHSMYGFYLKPNKYKVKYKANGGSGTADNQNAIYDKELTLRKGIGFSREGYTLTGWNTKANGTGKAYGLGKKEKNLTAEHNATVTLYAQWEPNTLKVTYNANGGSIDSEKAKRNIQEYAHNWNYKTAKQDPVNFGMFGLSRLGYARKDGAEWNTKANGSGRSFDQDIEYEMTDYAPNLTAGSRTITLYAQWEPNIYTITLDNRLTNPEKAGTEKLYKKYGTTGIFSDSGCTKKLALNTGKIEIPQKDGYKFKGYYSGSPEDTSAELRKEKINAAGILTGEKNNLPSGETWYAEYDYLIRCKDYADIPCDMEKADGDSREDPGVRITYDSSTKKVTAITNQKGCSVTLTGQPAGTEIGEFKSTFSASSASGNIAAAQSTEFPITILEGAAYRLKVTKGSQTICDRLVYYKDGRFRTLVKLGEQKEKEAAKGSSLAGSAWNADKEAVYAMYEYHGCSELKDIKEPGTVCRYFRYKDVNMAYSGNGATEGKNTLEYDVSLEDMYQFRANGFAKEKTETKYTEDEEAYECKVKYGFQGWEMKTASFGEKEQKYAAKVYETAEKEGVISNRTMEDINTYQTAEPIPVLSGLGTMSLAGTDKGAQGTWEEVLKAAASGKAHAEEFINLTAKWDAYPTIVVTPGDKLEFYEGEEVTKEKLTSHLTAHDAEDNDKNNRPYVADLNDKLRILKIVYPEPENHSQAAYEKTYDVDVPEGFLLDTYYLKLEEDEEVDVLVTFAIADSAGNTTEEEIPVKVKYNHYPEIDSEPRFYYLKEEANRGEITAEALIGRASAEDAEDGDISGELKLKDFDAQAIKMQMESKAEFNVTYQVTDVYKKTSYRTIKLVVWDEDAAIAEMPRNYVRYISEKYLDTLEKNSKWREPENQAYLKGILRNNTPIETWTFTHEDVLAVQDWITGGGEGNWKVGQEANREFSAKFAYCRK